MLDIKTLVFEELMEKFVQEEIMTKSDFLQAEQQIYDKFYDKYRKELRDDRRWIIGTILTVGFGLAGLMVALLHH